MPNIPRKTFRFISCFCCKREIQPGQRFHTLTQKDGDMSFFCEREGCQSRMHRLKEGCLQSGGIKRPV